ncbi:TetR family transcriptional regulator [Halorubrum sp. JWXQ-INN 858]|uniref:TetR/AcrR family transcriptional regulator n=1 Tax=Halorubrum sp. JWXQ-INN 858 TaxID=2690782 RepID=UPI001358F283|nr:TetR/AcrR family transcriptional regulator [Halorubrum sp. JWXQ-INN 858]MWV63984.1 TetR family transcriptional regulator [Halorubrum sp. JWXQ-INN 858]
MTDEPSTAEEIMDGVYRALCAHGYAGLTMQDIADECSKSKSLLHYHYDTKEDLLVAFLDHVISDFEGRVAERADRPPTERLVEFVCWFVFERDESERESFHIALLELRSQGPFNDRIREQLARSDRLLRGTVSEVLVEGIDSGVFRDVDVEETAALLVATLDGARTRQITMAGDESEGPAYTRTVAEATMSRVLEPLLAEGVELPSIAETVESLPARTGEEPGEGRAAGEETMDEDATDEDVMGEGTTDGPAADATDGSTASVTADDEDSG